MGVGRFAAEFVAKSAEKSAHKKALLKPRRASALIRFNQTEGLILRLSWRLQPKAAAAPKRGRGAGAEVGAPAGATKLLITD
jgi:hypothetical protein